MLRFDQHNTLPCMCDCRYFIEPENNFISISNMKDLVDYMEPHETGGILAHAFYRIVALYGQEIKQVCLLDH